MLKSLLQGYDVKGQKMDYISLQAAIANIKKAGDDSIETRAESLAASFVESKNRNVWGSFYGPMYTFENKETGEPVYVPDISEINADIIDYWSQRAIDAVNPLLKMRYSGLVWEFSKRITGKEPSYNDIKVAHINACVDAVRGDYAEHAVVGITYGKRAIEAAISIGDQELVDESIKTLIDYTRNYAADNKAGIWGSVFRLMLNHMNWFSAYEDDLLEEHIARFERLETAVKNEAEHRDGHFRVLMNEAELLSKYYTAKKNPSQAKHYLDSLLGHLRSLYSTQGGMWSQTTIMHLQTLYRQSHLDSEANRLYIDIQSLGASVISEMRPISVPIQIDKADIEEYTQGIIGKEEHETLTNYIASNVPYLSRERELQKEEENASPITSLMTTIVYNYAGVPVNMIPGGELAKEAKFLNGIYRSMTLHSYFMQLHINKMEELGIYTLDRLLEAFKDNLFIEECKRPLFERGLKSYFEGDYAVACSLLVPQFESAIRNIVALTGGDVLRPSKNPKEGNEYKSLEALLDTLGKHLERGKDVVMYFRILFTDKYGWNVRNLISHGLLPADQLNQAVADRIIHAFLVLTKITFLATKNEE